MMPCVQRRAVYRRLDASERGRAPRASIGTAPQGASVPTHSAAGRIRVEQARMVHPSYPRPRGNHRNGEQNHTGGDLLPWNLDNNRPIWLLLDVMLTHRIVSGQYPLGVRIPSVRDLAAEAGVNPNTMQRALAALEESGLVTAQRNTGRVVTQDAELISQTRLALARAELAAFRQKMLLLGFNAEEIDELLRSKEKTQ